LHIDPYYLESSDPTSFCHRYSPNPVLNIAGKFDFIVYTGDSVRHDKDKAFKRTEEQVLDAHKTVVEYVRKYFDLSRIKFIPTLGNNGEFEHNRLSQGPNAVLGNLSQIWAPLNLNLTSDFIKGGYFRQDIHSKLSVLSLNSLYFYKKNKIAPDCNVTDGPGALQLEWFERELKSARHEGRKIYISQHVSPLDDSNVVAYSPACFDAYVQLIGKYSDIICGHFTGHTDKDTVSFVTSTGKDEDAYSIFVLNETHASNITSVEDVVLVLTNAPSVKPTHNPAIRLYEYSTLTRNIGTLKDYTQYFVNLTEANEIGEAIWRIEYVASETYGMSSLKTKEWTRVLNKFRVPDSYAWKLYVKHITVS
ncbi:30208_t:CDS:2, partial [Racocetra persica]